MLNTQVSKYSISRHIKSGGMAEVYEGLDAQTGEKVAIKYLNPDFQNDKEVVQRFYKEGAVLEKLDHPNIVKFLYFTEISGRPIMVMEYLDGYDMNDLMQKQTTIDYQNFRNYFLQVLDAVIYAHSKGIVHRDIKPSNIFITKDGVVKLLDFGIVKIMTNTNNNNTTTGYGLLTPSYMSPEQAMYSKVINEKTDIYSLGITMYSVLKGENPYKNMSAFEIGGQVLHVPLPELLGHAALNKVIAKATAKVPEYRYQSVEEFKAYFLKVTIQCKGFTKNGDRCQKMTSNSNGYCFSHDNSTNDIIFNASVEAGPFYCATDELSKIIGRNYVTKDTAVNLVLNYIFERGFDEGEKFLVGSDSNLKKLFFNRLTVKELELRFYVLYHLCYDGKQKSIETSKVYKNSYISINILKLIVWQSSNDSVSNGDCVFTKNDFAVDGIYNLGFNYCIEVVNGRVASVQELNLKMYVYICFYLGLLFIFIGIVKFSWGWSNIILMTFLFLSTLGILCILLKFIADFKINKMRKY